MLVFLYGTLRRGEGNAHLLDQQEGMAKFIDIGTTVDKYPLIVGTVCNIPFLLDQPGTGQIITGDVYEVDDITLAYLDKMEGVPTHYSRQTIPVVLQGTQIDCEVYILEGFRAELLQREFISDYRTSDLRPRGLAYTPPTQLTNVNQVSIDEVKVM